MHAKTGRWASGLVILAAVLTGCIESATEVRVNRDGSGTVRIREFYSPQVAPMLTMAAQQMEGVAGEDAKDYLEAMIESKRAQMGPDAERVRSERIRNAAGWEGYEIEYRFADVRKLRLRLGDSPSPEEQAKPEDDEVIRFDFESGTPARLVVRQPPQPASDADTPAEPDMDDEMAEAMMPMMTAMMQGMRITFSVSFEAPIRETNSRFVSDDRSSLVLMDIPMDRIMGNPDAQRLLMRQAPDSAERLAAMDIEGVRLEPPDKAIEVTF